MRRRSPLRPALTAGLVRLAAVLSRLDRQQLDAAGCEVLRTP